MTTINRHVRFLLNGVRVEVAEADPTRSVLAWLREERQCTGTKEGCAEGDCGACTIVVGELLDDHLRLQTVNACIQFLPMLDGKAVFTVEYLRQSDGSLHPVQQAMVDHHGSQCGFCTPGFVMSLWNCYNQHESAGKRADRATLAFELTGNLCRCTGYRSILDAGEAMFDLPTVSLDRDAIVARLREIQSNETLTLTYGGNTYQAPRTLEELVQLRSDNPDSTLLAGCTDIGLWVNKQFRNLGDILYVGDIEALKRIEYSTEHSPEPTTEPAIESTSDSASDSTPGTSSGHLRIGAGVSLSDAYAAAARHYPQLAEMWDRFASVPIRNAGTLGGNVANGSPIGDSMPWLIALGADVELAGKRGTRQIPLEELYVDYMQKSMQPDEVITAIDLPLPVPELQLRTYKLAKRYDSDISAVCAAFALWFDGPDIAQVRIAFGGMAAIPKRAARCEAALLKQRWNESTVQNAMRALGDDFTPLDDMRASADYRLRTARNLLYRCFVETRPDDPMPPSETRVYHRMAEAL